jgi:hypothetical protein
MSRPFAGTFGAKWTSGYMRSPGCRAYGFYVFTAIALEMRYLNRKFLAVSWQNQSPLWGSISTLDCILLPIRANVVAFSVDTSEAVS